MFYGHLKNAAQQIGTKQDQIHKVEFKETLIAKSASRNRKHGAHIEVRKRGGKFTCIIEWFSGPRFKCTDRSLDKCVKRVLKKERDYR